ncbi:MAG: hypothetical protein KDK39_00840 [Leptospiraceae bacterium]|nr:hypothetical protein [Leptospiraceae bacterium]
MLGILLTLACACDQNDITLDQKHGPIFMPLNWFHNSDLTGRILLRDRNGNLRESGSIARQCQTAQAGRQGVCQDRIHFNYAQRDLEDQFAWNVAHPRDKPDRLQLTDRRGQCDLTIVGRAATGECSRILPLDEHRKVACRWKLLQLDGAPATMLEQERCSSFGFFIGEQIIVWQKRQE